MAIRPAKPGSAGTQAHLDRRKATARSGAARAAGSANEGQKRLESILEAIPAVREQLLAAIDDLAPDFSAAAIQAAAQDPDPRERNKVAVIERELDVLIASLEELAARALAEGQRLGAVPSGPGSPWRRLAELGVISGAAAARLQNVKDMRNELVHAYPPTSWRALHRAVEALLAELDRYKVSVSDWLGGSDILPGPGDAGSPARSARRARSARG